jgi:hypothetical protein
MLQRMPRFYFDVIDQGVIQQDPSGLEFCDLPAAVEEARHSLAAMNSKWKRGSRSAGLIIRIRDEKDSPVVTVVAKRGWTTPKVTFWA